MRWHKIYITIPFLIGMLAACSSTTKKAVGMDEQGNYMHGNNELPLPEVPSTLRTAPERADYILTHFWDSLDVNNNVVVKDTAYLEQAFVNYLSIMPYAGTEKAAAQGIDNLLHKISSNNQLLNRLIYLTELYLREYDSPMRNDEIYLMFGDAILHDTNLPLAQRERIKYNMHMAALNQIGTKANDFNFNDLDGNITSLYSLNHHPYLVILFYDPSCESCDATEQELMSSGTIAHLIDNGDIDILAISVEGEEFEWKRKIQDLPFNWKHGFDDGNIRMENIYDLHSLPSLYLLDNDNTVILKDVNVNWLISRLETAEID